MGYHFRDQSDANCTIKYNKLLGTVLIAGGRIADPRANKVANVDREHDIKSWTGLDSYEKIKNLANDRKSWRACSMSTF